MPLATFGATSATSNNSSYPGNSPCSKESENISFKAVTVPSESPSSSSGDILYVLESFNIN